MTGDARRTTAFFGRRKGHALRPRQAALFDTLLPRLALDLSRSAPSDLAALFPVPIESARLEIGFGAGEHLIAAAIANPKTGFIGCEPFVNGMAKALAEIERHQLANIRLHHGDALDLLGWLPCRSVSQIALLYPDPWPKRRHSKRRFVQAATLAEFARILRPGGIFHFASDWPDYVAWTLLRVLRHPDFKWTAERADDWRRPWPGLVETRYEAKAKQAGRAPCYLVFERRAPPQTCTDSAK